METHIDSATLKAEIWEKHGFRQIPPKYFLVDPVTMEELSSGFDYITSDEKGNFVGHFRGREETLDAYAGESIPRFYHEEFEENGFRIGKVGACKFILDPKTGKRMSSGYNEIYFQGNLLFGELGSLKYILNQNNKRRLSEGYQEIYIDEQGLLIGELGATKYQLDPITGKQVATLKRW
jgi:hypothetical protein